MSSVDETQFSNKKRVLSRVLLCKFRFKNVFAGLNLGFLFRIKMKSTSDETERRFQQASEFEHPKFSSEPSEFRAYLNLISIPIAETKRSLERASKF